MPTSDSGFVAAGLASGHAAVADVRCGQLVGCWRAHDAEITSVSSQGSHLLLTCSQVGDLGSGPCRFILLGCCCCCCCPADLMCTQLQTRLLLLYTELARGTADLACRTDPQNGTNAPVLDAAKTGAARFCLGLPA